MTTEPGAAPPPPQNVAALVDAIDARARQAGNEGAATVMQRMLGSVTEVLASIQDRIDHLEGTLGGGGGGGVAEAVQSGLAAFNVRLGRLEEAFVQAVDESGSGTQAVVDEVRTVVVRALEESAPARGKAAASLDPETRDALVRVESTLERLTAVREERPAQEVIGLALTAMGERLDGLEQRLVSAVQQHSAPAPSADLSTLDLSEQLAPILDRLDASEDRVAAAVDGTSRDALNASLVPVLDRLDSIERRIGEAPKSTSGTTVEDAFELVQVRIASLEGLMRARSNERVDPSAALRAALAPVIERMDELDAAHRSATARHSEGLSRVDATMGALPGRLASLEERVWAVVSSLTEGAGRGIDPTLLVRLEEAVDRLDRDESSARLVGLVEERMSAGLRAVTERTDEVRRALEQFESSASSAPGDDGALDDVVASLRALHSASGDLPEAMSAAMTARLAPLSDRLGGLDARLDAIADAVARPAAVPVDHTDALVRVTRAVGDLAARVDDVATRLASVSAGGSGDVSGLAELVTGAVRREAELLTQRVAALAVGVEASRVLLEQQLQETENSIGRKAGEVTRRLAADFGIRTRKNGPGGRRDPRELGSG